MNPLTEIVMATLLPSFYREHDVICPTPVLIIEDLWPYHTPSMSKTTSSISRPRSLPSFSGTAVIGIGVANGNASPATNTSAVVLVFVLLVDITGGHKTCAGNNRGRE